MCEHSLLPDPYNRFIQEDICILEYFVNHLEIKVQFAVVCGSDIDRSKRYTEKARAGQASVQHAVPPRLSAYKHCVGLPLSRLSIFSRNVISRRRT
jgi:hypothetical protein